MLVDGSVISTALSMAPESATTNGYFNVFKARVVFLELFKPILSCTYCNGLFSFDLTYFCRRASSFKFVFPTIKPTSRISKLFTINYFLLVIRYEKALNEQQNHIQYMIPNNLIHDLKMHKFWHIKKCKSLWFTLILYSNDNTHIPIPLTCRLYCVNYSFKSRS